MSFDLNFESQMHDHIYEFNEQRNKWLLAVARKQSVLF